MERKTAHLDTAILRSPLVPAAAIAYGLSALLGLPCVLLLFQGEYSELLTQDLIASGITNPSSLSSWKLIGCVVTVVTCLGCALLCGGLIRYLRRPVRGAGFLAHAAQWLLYGVTGAGILAAAVFLLRFIRYILISVTRSNAVMLIYSMLISEALMAALAVFSFFTLRKFLNCCIDSGTGIAYTCATGKVDAFSIPGFTATGFLILAVLGILLALDRVFTLTIVYGVIKSYYKLLIADHPGQWLQAFSLLLGSAGHILLCLYLRRCKRSMERALFEAGKRRK